MKPPDKSSPPRGGAFDEKLIDAVQTHHELLLLRLAMPDPRLSAAKRAASFAILTRLVRNDWQLIPASTKRSLLDQLAVQLVVELRSLVRLRIATAIEGLICPPRQRLSAQQLLAPGLN